MSGNLINFVRGTAKTWAASGGDVVWTLTSLSNAAGRHSAVESMDTLFGASHGMFYDLRFFTRCAATPTANRHVHLYMATGTDGTTGGHWQHDDGVTDAALSAELKLLNETPLGSAAVDEAAGGIECVLYVPCVRITAAYIQFTAYNETGVALSGTAAHHGLILTPTTAQIQAFA